MTSTYQRRTIILTKLLVGELSIAQAATLMKLSERQVWRLKQSFQRDGPTALVHGNRGRASARRLPEQTRQRIVELASTRYAGINDSHLTELLAEEEGISVSRVAVPHPARGGQSQPAPPARTTPSQPARSHAPGRPAAPARRQPP